MCQKKTPAMKQHHRSENEVTLAAPVNPGGRKALKKSGRSGSRLPTEDTGTSATNPETRMVTRGLEFTVLNYTPFELLMQNSALASYSLPQCPAVPDPFLTYQHVQNQDDCVYMLADLRCIDKKLHGEIFPMEERTRAKQRSNTTNVSPHITSTGKCDRSLSGANFYTSLRLLFSLTLILIGKRRERKQQLQASTKISAGKRASAFAG
ncbi:hypothetical protein T4A_13959 [Trichinella pseudospiralis]|uniref:Uncharacterized protein n=1 Tax=Trichinella pseudospiralis TaxID=6337 RepID=A0A0V1E9S5_TRIPS|nr:hypothetical protein T4A_13959 [Trichinella pseudospiralis]